MSASREGGKEGGREGEMRCKTTLERQSQSSFFPQREQKEAQARCATDSVMDSTLIPAHSLSLPPSPFKDEDEWWKFLLSAFIHTCSPSPPSLPPSLPHGWRWLTKAHSTSSS